MLDCFVVVCIALFGLLGFFTVIGFGLVIVEKILDRFGLD